MERAEKELSSELYEDLVRLYRHCVVRGLSPDTLYTYLNRSLLFLNYVQKLGKSLDDLELDDVEEYLSSISNPLSRKVYVRAIRCFAKANIKEHPVFYRLSRQIKYPKEKVKLPELPSPIDVNRLIQSARQPYKSIIVMLYEGGLRRCEALSLKYGDVEDWDIGYRVRVRFSKSLPRTVFIIRYAYVLRERLQQHRSKEREDWLFYNTYGEPIRPSALTMYIHRLCKRIGLNPKLLHPHNLRHLRATEMYKERKFTELLLMKYFGWKTRKMIDVYAKITVDDLEETVRKL